MKNQQISQYDSELTQEMDIQYSDENNALA